MKSCEEFLCVFIQETHADRPFFPCSSLFDQIGESNYLWKHLHANDDFFFFHWRKIRIQKPHDPHSCWGIFACVSLQISGKLYSFLIKGVGEGARTVLFENSSWWRICWSSSLKCLSINKVVWKFSLASHSDLWTWTCRVGSCVNNFAYDLLLNDSQETT